MQLSSFTTVAPRQVLMLLAITSAVCGVAFLLSTSEPNNEDHAVLAVEARALRAEAWRWPVNLGSHPEAATAARGGPWGMELARESPELVARGDAALARKQETEEMVAGNAANMFEGYDSYDYGYGYGYGYGDDDSDDDDGDSDSDSDSDSDDDSDNSSSNSGGDTKSKSVSGEDSVPSINCNIVTVADGVNIGNINTNINRCGNGTAGGPVEVTEEPTPAPTTPEPTEEPTPAPTVADGSNAESVRAERRNAGGRAETATFTAMAVLLLALRLLA